MKEIWKAIKGYEGSYEVSNTGKVRSMNYNRTGIIKELSPRYNDNGRGYLLVNLCKEGKYKHVYIHRLVVQAFIGEIPKGLVVNHKDENKQNNNVENLEICTYSYNNNYGKRLEKISNKLKGKISPMKGRKLSPEHRAKISERLKGVPWSQARRDAQNKQISHLTQI